MNGFEVVRQVLGVFAWLFGKAIGAVIGPMTWQPPRWALLARDRGRLALGDARRRPLRAAAFSAGALVVLVGGGYGVSWYKHRPKPIEIVVTVNAPPATPIDEHARPLPLRVSFSSSVAPLAAMNKPVPTGVELSPHLEGTWRWASDHELEFQPGKGVDWPVAQSYNVRLSKRGLVTEHILLDTYSLDFESASFHVTLDESEFYQDPVDPSMRKVVATFSFSHPVDPASFEKSLELTFVPSSKQDKEVPFKATVSYDKLHGKAFVHSAPVDLPQKDAAMRVSLKKGVHAKAGGRGTEDDASFDVAIPGLYNFLKITSTVAQVVDNEKNEPEQVVVIETTAGVSEAEMKRSTEAWLLPLYADADEQKAKQKHTWSDPEVVDAELLKKGQRVQLEPIAQEREFATTHSFRYKGEVGRSLYVKVGKGMRAFGGYILGDPALAIVEVPPFPAQLRILHSGSLLSMSGEKKLSVFARDIPGMRVEVARVLPEQLQYLATMSTGTFGQPQFSYRFDMDAMSERATFDKHFGKPGQGKPIYEAVDLSGYLGNGDRRGIFFLKVQGLDPDTDSLRSEEDSRLVVVTDLGILVKQWEDGSRDVFVASIHDGDPMAGVKVQVLGKNGQPVATATTDHDGRAHIESLSGDRREREPVMILASKGHDSSFLPLGGDDRVLDFSRFDVGGVEGGETDHAMSAYVFSDRGIYRPGEEIRAGVIVRANDWRTSVHDMPVLMTIEDPRGITVKKERVTLPASGLVELRHAITDAAPTGTYTIGAYVEKDDHSNALLGSTTVRVREFMPDKMKIAVHLVPERSAREGWVHPQGLSGKVTLTNLFGTPAEGRVVKAQLTLSPAIPSFPRLRDFHFSDPMLAKDGASEDLPDVKTDDKGEATLDLQLQRWQTATYRLTLTAQGFDEGGGHGVGAEAEVLVSPMAYLVGYKADGDLGYLSKGSEHKVELVAVGPDGERQAQQQLRAVLLERKFVSVLTKQPNGTYKYESVRREVPLREKPLSIAKDGTKLALPTERPGDFTMVVRNERELDLAKIEFSVAGTANLTRSMEKNAELSLQLKSKDIAPGQSIEMQIKAPYTGSGLITIERDRVYAAKWFKSSTTASVQTIALPDGLEGGGYVSVAYLRDAGSDEVFASPLSYAVMPFSVSRAQREVKLSVDVPEMARPGEPLSIKVKADRPTQALVFAVDEGILRVAGYKAPDPLAFFFQKRALGVRTSQILDLVLPEFSRLMAAVAPGGDAEGGGASHLNPFKRKHQPPVAFWSGVVDVGPSGKTLHYDVPDSFNGSLRVMAVAVEPQAIGAVERSLIVRGDYVISPSAPLAVAPGDEFELTAAISNNVDKVGASQDVTVAIDATPGLEIVGAKTTTLAIAPMHEGKVAFRLRATEQLGAATATLTASGAGKTARFRNELSVRPAVPYTVTFAAGHLKSGDKSVPVPRQLYAEYRELDAGISRLPLGLTRGLAGYLEKFPHGCTEQITSQAVPAIALGKHPEFGISSEAAQKSVHTWIDLLRTRQNEEGAFGLWAASPKAAPFASVWAMLVLTEAKDRGINVPEDMLKAGQGYLQGLATKDGDDLEDERLRAMAIYVLTRMGRVTTSYASALKKRLEADFATDWKGDLAAAYLASTLAILKQTDKASAMMSGVHFGVVTVELYEDGLYFDSLTHDAELLYLTARHFPALAKKITPVQIDGLLEPVFQGSYNTFSSAMLILGLETYGKLASAGDEKGGLSIVEVGPSGKHPLTLPASLLPVAHFAPDDTAVDFSASGDFGAYWLLEQKGYDKKVPDQALSHKIEVFREYTDKDGKPVDKVAVGDEVFVHVRLRSQSGEVNSLAVTDLLPGGFEPVLQERPRQSGADEDNGDDQARRGSVDEDDVGEGGAADEAAHAGDGDGDAHDDGASLPDFWLPVMLKDATTLELDYGDVREDRLVFYTHAEPEVKELVYQLRATNVGTYRTAPVLADSMYDRSAVSRSTGGHITVYRK